MYTKGFELNLKNHFIKLPFTVEPLLTNSLNQRIYKNSITTNIFKLVPTGIT